MSPQVDETMETCDWFTMSLRRGPIAGPLRSTIGLVLHVQTATALEELMIASGGGAQIPLESRRPTWKSMDPSKSLSIYDIPNGMFDWSSNATIYMPDQALIIDAERYSPIAMTNLSFLRLVGISQPEGITIGISGAYSENYIKSTAKAILAETVNFIKNYVTQINIKIKIFSEHKA